MIRLYDSTHNFYRPSEEYFNTQKSADLKYAVDTNLGILDKYNKHTKIDGLTVVKGESFGFFAGIEIDKESCISLGKEYELPWWGLDNRYRLTIESNPDCMTPYLVGYVKDDDLYEKADILLSDKSHNYLAGVAPVYIEGKIPSNFEGETLELRIKLYGSNGYERERLVSERVVNIEVLRLDYNDVEKSFYMDLWQQPCSWARIYGIEYFSDEHFELIEKYLRGMKELGQKVIDLIVSDFPWAGQMCFAVKENASRLYEYNIIKVTRKDSRLVLDFSSFDRYIELCKKVGIDEEINLFGLIGNWHGYDFGSPVEGYNDPIRVKVYDEDEGVYDFIREIDELKYYIGQIIQHIADLGLLPITKVIGDEPGTLEKFKGYTDFLNSCTEHKITYKYALHNPGFLEEYEGDLHSFSISTLLIGRFMKDSAYIEKIEKNSHDMTWFSCCFPETFNIFMRNPLIESRLTGMYTYLWRMKGMLRWAYAIFVEDPFKDIRYKQNKWGAGDMLFVYPGKDKEIVHTLRERNMLYGVQDFNIIKHLEKKHPDLYGKVYKDLNVDRLTGLKELDKEASMYRPANPIIDIDVAMDEYPNATDYRDYRNNLIKSCL